MRVSGFTIIDKERSYSKSVTDVTIDRYRLLKESGLFTNTATSTFIPKLRTSTRSWKREKCERTHEYDLLEEIKTKNRESALQLSRMLERKIRFSKSRSAIKESFSDAKSRPICSSVTQALDSRTGKNAKDKNIRFAASFNGLKDFKEPSSDVQRKILKPTESSEETSSGLYTSDITHSPKWSKTKTSRSNEEIESTEKTKRNQRRTSQGTQTDHILFIAIPIFLRQDARITKINAEMKQQSEIEIWLDYQKSEDSFNFRSLRCGSSLIDSKTPNFVDYDPVSTTEKINILLTQRSRHEVRISSDILQPLNVKFKENPKTGQRILLGGDDFYDVFTGIFKDSSGPIYCTVKLYKKTSTDWIDIWNEATFLKHLEGTKRVPKCLGLTCVELNSKYWPFVLVCDVTGCKMVADKPCKIVTFNDTLQCLNGEDEDFHLTKADWTHLCIDLCEMVRSFHLKHIVPLNITSHNILLGKEKRKWKVYFNGLLHSHYDNGKSILHIRTKNLPFQSLKMLNLTKEEVDNLCIVRRKRGINTYAIAVIFDMISKQLGISFGSLVKKCSKCNSISRPNFQYIIEKLGEIGAKYEKT